VRDTEFVWPGPNKLQPEYAEEAMNMRGRPPKPIGLRNTARSRLGVAMRELREAAEITLTAMAHDLGYSLAHLSRIEHGLDAASLAVVKAYDERLGCDGLLMSIYATVLDEREEFRLQRTDRPRPEKSGVSVRLDIAEAIQRRDGRRDSSKFEGEGGVADGALVAQGQPFIKSWKIRNAGELPWINRYLARIGALDGPGLVSSPRRFPIETTSPGDSVEVTALLKAPKLPGTCIANFKMVYADGLLCFPDKYTTGLAVEIVVLP